jgi:uncharacterized membrane protein
MPGYSWIFFWWVAFAGSHYVLSSLGVRRQLIARLGQNGFVGLYSLAAFATFIPLVVTYWRHKHDGPLLWNLAAVPGVRLLAIAIVGLGAVCLVLSFFQPSPTGMVPGTPKRSRGVTRITRHPLFLSISLWGLGHMLVNGFLGDAIFFGGFLVHAIIGALHQDARKLALEGESLAPFYAETSLLPFAAIAGGRNRLVLGEIPVLGLAIGVALAAALYVFHPQLFGP